MSTPLTEEVNCPRCGSDQKQPLLERRGLRIVWCRTCGIGYTDRRWTSDGARQYYQEGYFKGGVIGAYGDYKREEAEKQADFAVKYDYVSRFGRGGRLLDVGCATGISLVAAAAAGYRPEGVELSEWAFQNRCTEMPIQACSLTELPEGEPYDVVSMWDVIEHLLEPVTSFQKLARLVRPGGLLTFTYPDAGTLWARLLGSRWGVLTPEEHYLFFSSAQIRAWLTEFGFQFVGETVEKRVFTVRKLLEKACGLSLPANSRWAGVRLAVRIPYKKHVVFKLS